MAEETSGGTPPNDRPVDPTPPTESQASEASQPSPTPPASRASRASQAPGEQRTIYVERARRQVWPWLVGVVAVVLLCCLCTWVPIGLVGSLGNMNFEQGLPIGGGIALIRVEGEISSTGGDGGALTGSGASAEALVRDLHQAANDARVKAILIRINSPGGTAAGSEEVYLELKKIRGQKPIVASIADIGASGAYWIAAGCDKVIANPSSAVGSIGVIQTLPDFRGLYKKLGIDYVVIHQGKFKDLGDPNRRPTAEEIRILSRQGQMIYNRFVRGVAEGRGVPEAKIRKLATGMVWPGEEAQNLGLVDELGNYRDAVDVAARLGKIKGEPKVIEYRVPFLRQLFQDLDTSTNSYLLKLFLLSRLGAAPSNQDIRRP